MNELQETNIQELNIMSMQVLYNEFIAYIQTTNSTKNVYTRQLNQYINFLAINGIYKPTRKDIQAYLEHLKAKGLKPTTIQNYLVAVKQLHNFLETEYNYKNIAKGLKAPKVSRNHKKDALSMQQVKQVLEIIEEDTETGARDRAIILLMVTTATRTIELHRAKIEDLRNVNGKMLLYVQGKGHSEKDTPVVISEPVEKALQHYLSFRSKETKTAASPLFTSTSNNSLGKAITTRTISSIVKSRFRACGIDSHRLTAHSLRHTGITQAYKQMKLAKTPDALAEVQRYARHQNPSTSQIYIHEVEQAANIGVDLVTSALETVLNS